MLLTMHILGILVTILALFTYAGFGLTWLLRSRLLAPVLPLLTPVVGMAALSAIGHALAYLPIGTDQTAWPILGIFTVINGIAWWQGARPTLPRRARPVLLCSGVALLFALLPIYQAGYLTTVAQSTDVLSYLTRAEYFQSHGVMIRPQPLPGYPITASIVQGMQGGLRAGDVFLLAMLSSLLQIRPHLIFSVLMAVLYAMLPVGLWILARYGLRIDRRVALVAGLLVAPQMLLLWMVYYGFLSQASGLATWYAVITVALVALRSGGVRSIILAGLLLAMLGTLYHFYLVYLLFILSLASLFEWLRRSRRTLSRLTPHAPHSERLHAVIEPLRILGLRGVGMGVVMLAAIPVGWILFAIQLRFIASLVNREGNAIAGVGMPCFAHPGEMIGLANHSAACGGYNLPWLAVVGAVGLLLVSIALVAYRAVWRSDWQVGMVVALLLVAIAATLTGVTHQMVEAAYDPIMLQLPLVLVSGLSVVGLWLMVYGLLRTTPLYRWSLVALVIGLGIALWHQRFWLDQGRGFTYGYFKVVTLASPFAILLFVQGAVRLFRDAAQQSPWLCMPLRRGVVLLVALCFVASVAYNVTLLSDLKKYTMAAETLELQQVVEEVVPIGEPLLIVDEGMWDVYMLNGRVVFHHMLSPFYDFSTQVGSPRAIHYALVGHPDYVLLPPPYQHNSSLPGEPWFDDAASEVVWQNGSYTLLRRTDSIVADLPLLLGDWQQVLERPVPMTVADGLLRVEVYHPLLPSTLFLQQALMGPPHYLELIVAGEPGSVLAVTYHDESTTTHTLTREYETVLVPIHEQEPLALQVQQQGDAAITLVAVRVMGGM